MGRWLIVVAAAFAFVSPTAGVAQDRPKDAYQIIYDRMSDDHINELLASVRPALLNGNLEAAKQAFARLREATAARGDNDLPLLADLDMAWAVSLAYFEIEHDQEEVVIPIAIDSARSAVAGYSRFFGADHTETAIAKISLSDLLDKLPGKPQLDELVVLRNSAAAALAKRYGVGFDVVLDSQVRTARILLENGRAADHLQQALALINSLIATRPNIDDEESRMRLHRLQLMRVVALIKTDQAPHALAELRRLDEAKPRSEHECWLRDFSATDIVAALRKKGLTDAASEIEAQHSSCSLVIAD